MIEPLPPSLRTIRRTRPFAVTTLRWLEVCPLRTALSATEVPVVLGPHPLGILGKLIHDAMAKGLSVAELRASLSKRKIPSIVSPTGSVPLIEAVRPSTLRRRIGLAPLAADAHEPPSRGVSTATAAPKREHRVEGLGGELAGILDSVKCSPGGLEIEDYKTGAIRTDEGEVRPNYKLQLEAYGTLMRDNGERRPILLRLRAGKETFEWRLGSEEERRVRGMVSDASERIPQGRDVDVDELARPGQHCHRCNFRPVCPAYLRWAPEQWSGPVEGRRVHVADSWGVVANVDMRKGSATVQMRDAAGRAVSVLGVPAYLVEGESLGGKTLYWFALRAMGRRGRHYPVNFRIISSQSGESAYQASLYGPRVT